MIRKYTPADQNAVLEILRQNTPAFFDPSEELQYLHYLNTHASDYYVVEESDTIIAAGGINFGFDDGKTARISWDLVRPDTQGKGVGTGLTTFRINEIQKHAAVNKIVVRTTQLVFRFYEKLGFQTVHIEHAYWAPGLDLYQMEMSI